ncbi:hypothetical protein KPL70_014424 [Citrus sinensis]|nr:hypothetical protein KPL70_014424 [Citrus sinensis]
MGKCCNCSFRYFHFGLSGRGSAGGLSDSTENVGQGLAISGPCLIDKSVMKNVLSVSIITGLFLLQNRAVEQHQILLVYAKTAGPAVGGALFSWSQKRQDAGFLPVQVNRWFFFILNLVEALGVILTFKPFLTQRAPGFTVERPDFDLLQNLGIP